MESVASTTGSLGSRRSYGGKKKRILLPGSFCSCTVNTSHEFSTVESSGVQSSIATPGISTVESTTRPVHKLTCLMFYEAGNGDRTPEEVAASALQNLKVYICDQVQQGSQTYSDDQVAEIKGLLEEYESLVCGFVKVETDLIAAAREFHGRVSAVSERLKAIYGGDWIRRKLMVGGGMVVINHCIDMRTSFSMGPAKGSFDIHPVAMFARALFLPEDVTELGG
ncbi:hypothetical protein FFLO_05959 [Filobasidium floriforme]|uniref:Uncharacterized protein n=1 Tax=Filobasidium floriforme TaxID=5210 RepID=A0A8K0NL06_9TREE|nr:uncharacterized protein HD553DRAFT_346738 [Filobasidium floriforme]KAG7528733.1 hypothetical protein FFLO_05959 [Filobasidium floriforme]KAH8077288.1 hypothetical protein HD553DRAFT_346738 [Filobasidium floriforme]